MSTKKDQIEVKNKTSKVSYEGSEDSLSKRFEKVDKELGYPKIGINRKKLNDIWNELLEEK